MTKTRKMSAPRRLSVLATANAVLSLGLLVAGIGCTATQNAAAKDPMKCERDPKCQDKSRANDCSTQCSDDPACVDRCEQINQGSGKSPMGH